MAIMQHRRATTASMFQNGISRNTKCDIMVGFPKSSHKYWQWYALQTAIGEKCVFACVFLRTVFANLVTCTS